MAKFVDESDRAAIEGKLQIRLSSAANVIIAGPRLGQTDECSAVVTATIGGRQRHEEFNFSVGERSIKQVVADLNREIVLWMQRVSADPAP